MPWLAVPLQRRFGRVVDCVGLENRRLSQVRGFESLSLRRHSEKNRKRLIIKRLRFLFFDAFYY
ncbi:MAG: hypothetical protein RI894_759 [Bacteroidota bacterium]